MVVQHNLLAMNSNRQLGITKNSLNKSTEKLSSGYRINRAADDAAGLAISEKMRSQIRGLDQASTNAMDGISVVQIAEGALNEVHAMLQRMNEIAVQAANDTNTSTDRDDLKLEIDQLAREIDRVASTTQFNTMNLLDGTFQEKNLQVGALSGQSIELNIKRIDCHGLGLVYPILDASGKLNPNIHTFLSANRTINNIGDKNDETQTAYAGQKVQWASDTSKKGPYSSRQSLIIRDHETAGYSMQIIQNAIDLVSEQRATLGSVQNRLEHTINNLDTTSENTSAAESRIRDTDMAKEMVSYSINNILQQAGQSMLAQANSSAEGVLSLLQ